VVIFSATTTAAEISAALRSGASAYVLKTVNPLDLPAVIRQAVEGTVYYPPPATAAPTVKDTADLTEREREILSNIYRKLGVPNRTAAARFAHDHGLIDANDLHIADTAECH
jgi:DNA-binding NarL/FixJ family response regulator